MAPAEREITCSTISLNRHEPMLGSAPRADVWLLLTYSGPLGAHALEDSDLPDPVKQHLTAELERLPHARLQLITPDPSQDQDRIEFTVAHVREVDPVYSRFELTSYEALLDLEIEQALGPDQQSADHALRQPFYLVCTNGRRDPCCAQYGPPVFQAFQSSLGGRVRQSSHIGSHRFAANVVAFPHGLVYGRIRPELVQDLLSAGQEGRYLLDSLRGRACYSKVVQAADGLLRQELGNDNLIAYRLRNEQQIAENRWQIGFEDEGSGEVHQVEVESITAGEPERVSCWSEKLAAVTSYQLRSHVVNA